MFNREKITFLDIWLENIDKKILFFFLFFSLFGLLSVYTSSYSVASRIETTNNLFFFKKQIIFTSTSIFLTIIISFFDEKLAKKTIFFFLFFSLLLLIAVPFLGYEVKGSKRWIQLPFFSIQPVELIKPAFILFNAIILSFINKNKNKKFLKLIILDLIIFTTILFFLKKQPDIGNCILFFIITSIQVFFVDNISIKYAFLGCFIFLLLFFIAYKNFPHVSSRVDGFLISFKNVNKASYQIKRSILAYQNANLLGKGFMEGDVKNFIPDSHTDFIFSVITEEFGCLVSSIVILYYFYIFLRIILKSKYKKDDFIFFANIGLASIFFVQSLINISVSLNLIPTKGMTLPFISYGGSSSLSNAIIFGYILIFTKKNIENEDNLIDRVII